jgi:hypothetical protein
MSVEQISEAVGDLISKNKSIFLKTEPEVPDFTTNSSFKVILSGSTESVEFNVEPNYLRNIAALFDATIFDKDLVDRLFVWNIKSLCSYVYFVSKKNILPTTNLFDLKIIEGFLGVRKKPPENYNECIHRIKAAVQHKSWQKLYKTIHLPLALRVLPAIETQPLLNEDSRRCEFPYYEIEGQINGRMNCLRKYARSYLPHNMGPDVKKVLKPRGYGLRFVCSDFRHCEVTVLQWLSNDFRLKEILDSGKDLHEQIYEIVTGDSCNSENKRKLSKKMFLPVMYGCGPSGLAHNLSVTEGVAAELIGRIKQNFSVAWEWMQSRQEQAKEGVVEDFFGRPRQFDDKQSYLARNFAVQGVAATACQEKLILLYNELNKDKANIVFSVHDGFGLVCQTKAAHETFKTIKQVCESESELCPGLKMKVEVKFGAKLDNMKVLWK